jgi:uncharacterized protein (DUF362 family)
VAGVDAWTRAMTLARRADVVFTHLTPDAHASAIAEALGDSLDHIGHGSCAGETWAIKLNLTCPEYIPGVVNSPRFVEGVCRWAADAGVRIVFVEGDGGNGAYSARDTFDANQVTVIAARYGMTTASLSERPWTWRETQVGGRMVRLPYSPFFARREYDRFVTAPLFKSHIFTKVSLGMKNLWGCIPDGYRMYYHHMLHDGIVALYKELKPDFAIFDGIVGLRGRGPMDGEAIALNAVMVSASVPAGEAAALEVMGVDITRVRHLAIARDEGLLPPAASLTWRGRPDKMPLADFSVTPSLLNYGSIALTHVPALQRLVYHSSFSGAIYAVVDRLRPGSIHTRLVKAKREGRFTTTPLPRQ